MTLTDNHNVIRFADNLSRFQMHYGAATLYRLIEYQKYQDIELNFANIENAYPDFMLPFIALVRRYRKTNNVDFEVTLPSDERVRRFFENTNYNSFLEGSGEIRRMPYYGNIPAMSFRDEDEQHEVVDLLVGWMLENIEGIKRDDLKAFEWAMAEITDNVITHADDDLGGLVQATYFPANNAVQFVICDAGIGIAASLKSDPEFSDLSDQDALMRAVQEGVTGKKETNQGNGLYGTFELARVSGGDIYIHSGHATLSLDSDRNPEIRNSTIPYNGTAIICRLKLGNENLIAEALKIKGQSHQIAYDYIDKITGEEDEFRFYLKDEAKSFASRAKAKVLRTKVENLIKTTDTKVLLDFRDVSIISSSFADEFFAKLFDHLGPLVFMQRISVRRANKTISSLLDRSLILRMRNGHHN